MCRTLYGVRSEASSVLSELQVLQLQKALIRLGYLGASRRLFVAMLGACDAVFWDALVCSVCFLADSFAFVLAALDVVYIYIYIDVYLFICFFMYIIYGWFVCCLSSFFLLFCFRAGLV